MANKKLPISILGASGYTGVELLRLLAKHPEVEVVGITSEQNAGKPITEIFPGLVGFVPKTLSFSAMGSPKGPQWPGLDDLLKKSTFFFAGLPHGTSMACIAYLQNQSAKVIDLSADFRLKDVKTYEKWYQKHEAPHLLGCAVYGLPEFYRKKIKNTSLVAVPGCYPTGAILALAPYLKEGLLQLNSIIIDSKSGTSGAGRTPKTGSLFSEINGGIRAYGVSHHRHIPEINQELGLIAHEKDIKVTFTPHLVPMTRGILTCAYANLKENQSLEKLLELAQTFYQNEKFIRVKGTQDPFPDTNHVLGSYFCDLTLRLDQDNKRIIAISAIDNLCRGASGMAVTALNIMNGWPENTGLDQVPLFP